MHSSFLVSALLAVVVVASGCIPTGPLLLDSGGGLHPANCVMPVRATVASVQDRRGSAHPHQIGTERASILSRPIVVSRPPEELLRETLTKTLERCASAVNRPGDSLSLTVDLATFELNITQVGSYQVETSAKIAFSVRVFDATGKKFLDSFDVETSDDFTAQLGMIPDPVVILDRTLDRAADRFTWEFVPTIRKHGS